MRMCKIIIEVQIPQIHSHTNSFNETCVVVVVVVVVPWLGATFSFSSHSLSQKFIASKIKVVSSRLGRSEF